MSSPIPLRGDFDASQLRVLARKSKDGPQARRLLALAAIYEGATRTEAAKIGGVGLQIIPSMRRGPAGLLDSRGQPSKLNDAQRQAIARMRKRTARLKLPSVSGTRGLPNGRLQLVRKKTRVSARLLTATARD